MPVIQKISSLDTYYDSLLKTTIINDMSAIKREDINTIVENIQTQVQSGSITSLPTCNCGYLKGMAHKGKLCPLPDCNSVVESPFDKVDPVLWMRKPSNIIGFISPMFWTMLFKTLSTDTNDPVLYLCDPTYKPVKETEVILAIKNYPGLIRDYNHTVENLDKILNYLSMLPTFSKPHRQIEIQRCIKLWNEKKSEILSTYMPLTSSRLFVKEKTSKGSFTSLMSGNVLSTALAFIANVSEETTPSESGTVVANTIHQLSKIYTETLSKVLVKKEGTFRQHLYSSKLPFTFRGVIVAKTKGRIDGLTMPYGMMVALLQPMIINKLRHGTKWTKAMSVRLATEKFFSAVKCFDQEVYNIMNQLNKEAYTGNFRVMFLRNPVLHITSLIYMFVETIKTDVDDTTIGFHMLATSAVNGDFDFSALNPTVVGSLIKI